MNRQQMMWVMLVLWAAVGALALYRQQHPGGSIDTIYILSFGFVFIASMIYLYLRMRQNRSRD